MLYELEYDVTFSATGRRLSERIQFQKGFGTICGRNEGGKSASLEYIRYALFGTSALRGSASDFKSAWVKLTFGIGGQKYVVLRKPSSATLWHEGEEIAVGTTPVNTKIVELFGFGLKVFDVACAANQGDLEALGNMRPTERKQMVDSVIGLGVIEQMAKWAGGEAKILTDTANSIRPYLQKPEAPEAPLNYRPSGETAGEVDHLGALEAQANKLAAIFREAPVNAPTQSRQELDTLDAEQKAAMVLHRKFQSLPAPSPYSDQFLQEQLDLHKAWDKRPDISLELALEGLEVLDLKGKLEDRKHLEKELARLLAGQTECPACAHRWSASDDRIGAIQQEISQLPEVQGDLPLIPLTRKQLLEAKEVWDSGYAEPERKPELPVAQIRQAQKENTFRREWEELKAKGADKEPAFVDVAALRHQWERFEAYAQWLEVEPQTRGLKELREQLTEATVYERLLEGYAKDEAQYQDRLAKLDKLTEEAEVWKKVQTSLRLVSQRVKQYLVPSLNVVASHYLQKMSGGERQVIAVTEDFDISVDGQPLHTLSGSGKAIANLALRFGLGQVLTNNKFSVFIGDEIDASMDKNRAEHTAQTIQSLKDRVSQLLLITHKYPDADYYIELGITDGHSA